MPERLESVVAGAGVIGLAIGRALSDLGREVIVLEREADIGLHSSSRNSEVIHAGLHYPDDSLKAKFCVQGNKALYAFCSEHMVDYKKLGKLIVATIKDEIANLEAINEQATRNGVTNLRFLVKSEVNALDPAVECVGALLSPSTGIIDSHGLLLALHAEIERYGGAVVLNQSVRNVRVIKAAIEFSVNGEKYRCNEFVNCAGLWAPELLSKAERFGTNARALHFAKGHYYAYQEKSPFSHLVYPVPAAGGLGIHATNDLSGAARFGPDVTWVDSVDYGFDESRKEAFVTAIKKYFPAVDESKLVPAYTGVRPKLHGPGKPAADFDIRCRRIGEHCALVTLFGIDSPGLTASLAIADHVRRLLGHK